MRTLGLSLTPTRVLLALSTSLSMSLLLAFSTHATVDAATLPPVVTHAQVAFSPQGEIHKLILTGTVTWNYADVSDTGTAILSADEDGSGVLTLVMQKGGKYSEAYDPAFNGRSCTWQDANEISHQGDSSVCALPTPWWMTSLTLQPTAPNLFVADKGLVEVNGRNLRFLALTMADAPALSTLGAPIGFGSVEVGLDSTTLLPTLSRFLLYPNGAFASALNVEVTYGDYSLVNGIQIPHSIQRRVNGFLVFDIQITQASLS